MVLVHVLQGRWRLGTLRGTRNCHKRLRCRAEVHSDTLQGTRNYHTHLRCLAGAGSDTLQGTRNYHMRHHSPPGSRDSTLQGTRNYRTLPLRHRGSLRWSLPVRAPRYSAPDGVHAIYVGVPFLFSFSCGVYVHDYQKSRLKKTWSVPEAMLCTSGRFCASRTAGITSRRCCFGGAGWLLPEDAV